MGSGYTEVRYFDDKAVDPPKRRTRGKGRVIKVRDDGKDKAADISCYCLCNHVQHVCFVLGVQDGCH